MALKSYDGYLYAATYRYSSGGIGGTEVWRYEEIDTDGDGITDDIDNCPNKPNGLSLGTCSSTSDKPSINCTSDADCAEGCSSNGLCIKDQRDNDSDGFGDVCDYCDGDGDRTLMLTGIVTLKTTALWPVIRSSWMQTKMAEEMCVMIPITTVVEDAANRCVSREC